MFSVACPLDKNLQLFWLLQDRIEAFPFLPGREMIFSPNYHHLVRRGGRALLSLAWVLCCLMASVASAQILPDVTSPPADISLNLKLEANLPVMPEKFRETTPAGTVGNAGPELRESIGTGDQLLVTVFGQPDLTADVTVGDSGVITLPLVGKMAVGGKTANDVAETFSDRLEQGQYLRNPKVSVRVVQQVSRNFSILGEVQRPGRFPMMHQLTVLDALSLAGGITAKADKAVSILRRQPGKTEAEQVAYIPLKIDAGQAHLVEKLSWPILPNDVLFVAQQKSFYVYGEIRRPGMYQVEDDLNVMRVLSIGGGMTERGSARRISIHRKSANGDLREIHAGIGDPVLPDDVVFINERIF